MTPARRAWSEPFASKADRRAATTGRSIPEERAAQWVHDGSSGITARLRRVKPARRSMAGVLLGVALVAGTGASMVPLRAHLSVATDALVLVVPVVVGVAIGGFFAGVVVTAMGFLVYDYVFIPPYYTLSVGAAQNWTALGVYVIVMIVVAQVVARMDAARSSAQQRAAEVRRLFDISELLVRESSAQELLETIVTTVASAFDLEGAALLLPAGERLELVAWSGLPLSDRELRDLSMSGGVPVSVESASVGRGGIQTIALTASSRPIGLLALRGLPPRRASRELLRAFANHLALALERSQLREQALRTRLLEEVDRLRRSLVGAVSHDLRTPLATIKVSTSTLLDPESTLGVEDASELLRLIDLQADRLDRLVANLLDMTRIQSGTLELRRRQVAVEQLLQDALSVLGPSGGAERVEWHARADLPLVEVDQVLICQVLANLIDNATRYSPGDSPVTVSAAPAGGELVEVTVSDLGPGVPADERASIFQMVSRREAGGRGGLGLAIAQAFVEAHGQRIWVQDGPGGGTSVVFTLPCAKAA
jgi:two-component system sensor histidine kinase KdpD